MANEAIKPETPAARTPAPLRSLTSRLNHPVTISYGDSVVIVPPRGSVPNIEQSLLGSLPNGVNLAANVEV